jgi:hypothetical protein
MSVQDMKKALNNLAAHITPPSILKLSRNEQD